MNVFARWLIFLIVQHSSIAAEETTKRILKAPNPAKAGQWSEVYPAPLVPVAAANLPDGRVLYWSAYSKFKFKDIVTSDSLQSNLNILCRCLSIPNKQEQGDTIQYRPHEYCLGLLLELKDARFLRPLTTIPKIGTISPITAAVEKAKHATFDLVGRVPDGTFPVG